jgi:hypothetical protein
MRWRWIVGLVLLGACRAGAFEQQRLADGSWQLTCRAPMDACVREIEKTCRDKRYRIVGGSSELRLRDAPPYETEYPTSRIGFVCSGVEAPVVGAPAAPDASDLVSRMCGPGDTRICVGAGACSGGQTCKPDGSGFGPCDCGSTAPLPATMSAGKVPPSDAGKMPSDAGTSDAR